MVQIFFTLSEQREKFQFIRRSFAIFSAEYYKIHRNLVSILLTPSVRAQNALIRSPKSRRNPCSQRTKRHPLFPLERQTPKSPLNVSLHGSHHACMKKRGSIHEKVNEQHLVDKEYKKKKKNEKNRAVFGLARAGQTSKKGSCVYVCTYFNSWECMCVLGTPKIAFRRTPSSTKLLSLLFPFGSASIWFLWRRDDPFAFSTGKSTSTRQRDEGNFEWTRGCVRDNTVRIYTPNSAARDSYLAPTRSVTGRINIIRESSEVDRPGSDSGIVRLLRYPMNL